MDKVKVNNQVVKMRKHVKRARLFAINKFTKQLKQLQNKKGNDSQAEKNQRKVERLLEKVKILKKMVPDFVSKKALSKEKDWNALLAQKNIPLEDMCLALLASDKEVEKEVEKFRIEECQLAEKIPTLFLEWEIKSKMPKTPDKKKTALDIKKQKLGKIAMRKYKNFKGATFPNNVAVNKKFKASDEMKNIPSDQAVIENSNADGTEIEDPEPMEDDQDWESHNDSDDRESGDFFTKPAKNDRSKNLESMEDDLDSPDNSDEDESEEFSTKASKIKKSSSIKKHINNIKFDNSAKEESGTDSKVESNKDSQLTMYERFLAFSKNDTQDLKSKKSKLSSTSRNTKAIKVFDLSKLQDSDQIPIIQSADTEDLSTPQTVVPKKDSFFLDGDKEVESSTDEESNINKFRDLKTKQNFFNRNDRNEKFMKNHFGDKPRRSFDGFKEKDGFQSNKRKDFNLNGNKFQNNKRQDRSESRFQNNKSGKSFDRNENGFKKNSFGNNKFNNKKMFDNKSKGNSYQLNDSAKMNLSRDNKKKVMSDSFLPKSQSSEKGDKNVNLHPSWEAKNKLKEAAKSGFKGKRMLFD